MKILHIFDHSLPLHSGYTFRSRAILQQQRKLGYQTCHVTSPKHPTDEQGTEQAEGFSFYRTLPYSSWFWRLPVLKELAVVLALKKRILDIIRLEKQRPILLTTSLLHKELLVVFCEELNPWVGLLR